MTNSLSLATLAPAGVEGRVWAKVLKEQLLSSKQAEPTDAELLYFARVCQSSGLDPAKREIYGIYRGGKLSIQTGIDGLRVVAERSGSYAGSEEYEFEYNPDIKVTVNDMGSTKVVPNKAKATVLKVVAGQVVKTTRTANWADYYPGDKMGQMWRKFPEIMLGKCAEAQALRAAFPNVAQLYLEEETQNNTTETPQTIENVADSIKNATTTEEIDQIVNRLNVDEQKQIVDLAFKRIQELSNATAN